MFNAKDLLVNYTWIDNHLIKEYVAWDDFYSNCPLMSDLGESVNTYAKTYIIYENNNGLLFSNGIYYDKDSDILTTYETHYKDWYSKLLLDYNIYAWFVNKWYLEKPVQFTALGLSSMVIIRNRLIGSRNILDGIELQVFEDQNMLEDSKSIVVYKNQDTYITNKIEKVYNHELYYSIRKLDSFTEFSESSFYADFSDVILEYANRLGLDITSIASLASGVLFSVYGSDKFQVVPKMLNMNPYMTDFTEEYHEYSLSNYSTNDDDTSKILYHGYLGLEYLYDYRYNDYTGTIDLFNQYLLETFDITTDILKYIVPTISFMNGRYLTEYEKYFGFSRLDRPLNNFALYKCNDILTGQNDVYDNTITVLSVINNSSINTTMSYSDLLSEFYTIFSDLSSESMSTFIGDITNITELIDMTSYVPILMVDKTTYSSYRDSNTIPKIYLFTLIFYNIMRDFITTTQQIDSSDSTHQLIPFAMYNTNLSSMDISTYVNLTEVSQPYPKSVAYSNAMINLNYKFGVVPLETSVFNPQIFDELDSIASSLTQYGSSTLGFSSSPNIERYSSDLTIDIDTTTGDQFFFASEELSGLVYDVFRGDDLTNITYQTYEPETFFMYEYDNEIGSINDIMLSFDNDNTRLQNIPVNIETSNIVKIPYQGLLLLNNIIDDDKLEINNLQIQRDYTTNSYKCKLTLLKYDQIDAVRTIKFQFVDGNEIRSSQQIAYEFGLGFELVSSDNIDNMEMIKLIYVVLDKETVSNNIFIDKIMQDVNQLKLVFKKLTADPILLRTVIGYTEEEEIINTSDSTI